VGLGDSSGQPPGDGKNTSGTHRLIPTIHTLAAFQLVAMNVRNDDASACNVTPDTGSDGVGIWNVTADFGNDDFNV
jgi:hypothetical protein